jgi:hypothetical protein
MKFNDPEIEKLYEHLSRISRQAYKNPYLISNVVFSKQESRGRILESFLSKEVPPQITFFFALKKLFLYAIKNVLSFVLIVITAMLHLISGQRVQLNEEEELIVMDVYFAIAQILNKGEFKDTYFPGLSDYLKKTGKSYVYIPKWFGSKNPFKFFQVFAVLRKNKIPVLTQFQILTPIDYLKVLRFLIFYPISVIQFMKTLGVNYEDKLVKYALWNTLDGLVTENYMGFLLGQRLSSKITRPIKCLSWYENLAADKTFYSGLRTGPGKAEIVGAQLFIRPDTLMNIVPDENEIPFKVVPDKILVNGPGYRFDSEKIRVDVGPALRYRYLFNSETKISSEKFILVVLPYWDDVANYILDVILEVEWEVPVTIKFHPTMNWGKYKTRIPKNFKVVTDPLSILLPKTLIAIGHSTGALIEAASLGIPAIDVQYHEEFSHNYMPETGRGILWEQARNANEVKMLVEKFQLALQESPERIREEAKKMLSFCFSEPKDELISRAFELA